jgi:SAM-dependent methyltransferase
MRLAKLQDGSRWRADRFCTKGGWIDSWAEGKVKSLYELHELLGFEYHVEQSGGLYGFSDGSFQLVVSAGGLEHVKEDAVPTLIAETERILEPNGWALHRIDTSDHLAHYDKSVPRKLYLSFSEPPWHRLFENKVQYVNRIQRSDWLRLFMENKFELIEEESNQTDISPLKLAARYSQLPKKDLECTVLQMLLRKPSRSVPGYTRIQHGQICSRTRREPPCADI